MIEALGEVVEEKDTCFVETRFGLYAECCGAPVSEAKGTDCRGTDALVTVPMCNLNRICWQLGIIQPGQKVSTLAS